MGNGLLIIQISVMLHDTAIKYVLLTCNNCNYHKKQQKQITIL